MSLKEYKRKRDFKKTKEPPGKVLGNSDHRFVIQKHAASHLHYDFRLELNGVLKSWAVPKGVPFAQGEKRLAVQVEDHPVSYIDFEGTIPKGQYGGGTVMVWDQGTYSALSAHPARDLERGKLHVVLEGKKLRGEWFLVRMRDGKNWLLGKAGESLKPVGTKQDDTSALSGLSMKAIGQGKAVWKSHRDSSTAASMPAEKKVKSGRSRALPRFVEPMKARLISEPRPGDWIYEVKWDGFRALAFLNGDEAQLLSRNNKDFGRRFPSILKAVQEWNLADSIVDGEIVALDEEGRSSFQMLQAYDLGQEKPALYYYVFDLLRFQGEDLRLEPLEARKALLEKTMAKAPPSIRFSSSLKGPVAKILAQAGKLHLEGLIGKRSGSVYEAGERTGSWIKLKLQNVQEMVIGGFTDPEGSRTAFGSLLVGYQHRGELVCAGKVGSGFNDASLRSLGKVLKGMGREECPFINLPEKQAGRYGAGITRAEMKRCHWVEPTLVCQVKFSEWTRDGKLRQPVFLGLRPDKSAREVVREKAA